MLAAAAVQILPIILSDLTFNALICPALGAFSSLFFLWVHIRNRLSCLNQGLSQAWMSLIKLGQSLNQAKPITFSVSYSELQSQFKTFWYFQYKEFKDVAYSIPSSHFRKSHGQKTQKLNISKIWFWQKSQVSTYSAIFMRKDWNNNRKC